MGWAVKRGLGKGRRAPRRRRTAVAGAGMRPRGTNGQETLGRPSGAAQCGAHALAGEGEGQKEPPAAEGQRARGSASRL